MNTTSRQVIIASTGLFPQHVVPALGKPTVVTKQSGYVPRNTNQTILQHSGATIDQQPVFGYKATVTNLNENNYESQSHLTVLQPNSFYTSTMPIHPSSQMFQESHIQGMSTHPQIVSVQASETVLNQPQILGLQAISPIQSGLSWRPTNLPLYQNPIIMFNPHSGIQTAMHLPVAASEQPNQTASIVYKTVSPVRKKKSKLNLNIIDFKTPSAPSSSVTTVHGNVNQTITTSLPQLKFNAIHPTGTNTIQTVNNETISAGLDGKAPATSETKIPSPPKSLVVHNAKILQTYVVPTSTANASVVSLAPSTLTIGSSADPNAKPSNIKMETTNAFANQALFSPVVHKFVALCKTNPQLVQKIMNETIVTGIVNKLDSVETEIPSSEKSQQMDSPICKCDPKKTLLLDALVSPLKSALDVTSSPKPVMTVSSFHTGTSASSVVTASSISTVPSDNAFTPGVTTVISVGTFSPSVTTVSSDISSIVSTVPSVNSIAPNASTVSSVSTEICLTNKASSNFNVKPSLVKVHNGTIVTSHQTRMASEILSPPITIQKQTLEKLKEEQLQKEINDSKVLTHYIDGFVIQESSKPFPVSQPLLLDLPCRILPPNSFKSPGKVPNSENKLRVLRPRNIEELIKCEFCETVGCHYIFKWRKRFCSMSCVKQYTSKRKQKSTTTVQDYVCTGRRGRKRKRGRKRSIKQSLVEKENLDPAEAKSSLENDSTVSYITEGENSASENESPNFHLTEAEDSEPENESSDSYKAKEKNSAPSSDSLSQTLMEVDESNNKMRELESGVFQKLPSKWTVQDVFEFVHKFPGCSEYAENFKSQEIDGQVLLLLNDDHLISSLGMKLGPALKLLSQVKTTEEELNSQQYQI